MKTRETREGRPLLTVETEANGDSKSTNERGPSLVGLLGLSCRYKRFLSCLGCYSSRPRTKYFFLTVHFLNLCSHCPASRAGGRAGSSVIYNMCLWWKRYMDIGSRGRGWWLYCSLRIWNYTVKKRFTSFPSPAGMSLTKLPLGWNNPVMTSLFPPRESLIVTSNVNNTKTEAETFRYRS